jgi:hypothetical protein
MKGSLFISSYVSLLPMQSISIQQLVISGFEELGVTDPHAFVHTILLRDRFYAGQRFQCDGVEAVCRAEENVLQFYGPEGQLLKTVTLGDEQAIRKAA